MKDIWGRELVSGDLVLDLSHYYKYTVYKRDLQTVYGLIISSTHMLIKGENRFRIIKCVEFDVYKIANPLLQEKEIYQLLVSGFQEWQQKEAKKKIEAKNKRKTEKTDYLKEYKIGDILYDENNRSLYGKSYYIYYGYCEITDIMTNSKSYGHLYVNYTEYHLQHICEIGYEFKFSNRLLIGDVGRDLDYSKGNNYNSSSLKFLKNPSKSFKEVYSHINLIGDSVTLLDYKYEIKILGDLTFKRK